MPEKQGAKSFGQFALIVRRKTRGSETVSFAVVLVTFLAGRWIDITRYDTEHGLPHRDVLGAKQGLRDKRWMNDIPVDKAFEYAIRDGTENAASYLQDHLAHGAGSQPATPPSSSQGYFRGHLRRLRSRSERRLPPPPLHSALKLRPQGFG